MPAAVLVGQERGDRGQVAAPQDPGGQAGDG